MSAPRAIRFPRSLALQIAKSSRHSRIAGAFGEALLLYSLSKRGYEVCSLDHTGIDLLAYHPKSRRRLGISVKCRTRVPGSETEGVYIRAKEFRLIENACRAYAARPFLGIVLDRHRQIEAHLVSLAKAIKVNRRAKTLLNFKVGAKQIRRYRAAPDYFGLVLSYSGFDDERS